MLGGALLTAARYRRRRAARAYTRVRQDAAIGIVLSVFFGAGIALSRMIQNMSTTGSKAGLDSYILGKTAGIIAADVALIAGAATACVGLVALLFKEFLLISFDVEFARVQGWPARRVDLALTGLLAVVVVIGLPAVGVVMMAALLILPGVTARFWTERLPPLLLLAACLGAGIGLVGTALSATYDQLPAGPIITLVGTALFAVSALAAPRRGLIARLLARWRDRWQADYAELLRILYEHADTGTDATLESLTQARSWSRWRVRRLVWAAQSQGDAGLGDAFARSMRASLGLTVTGWDRAIHIVRRRRLWQLLMTEYPDLVSLANPLRDDALDTILPPEVVADLTDKLRQANRWPDATRDPSPEGGR